MIARRILPGPERRTFVLRTRQRKKVNGSARVEYFRVFAIVRSAKSFAERVKFGRAFEFYFFPPTDYLLLLRFEFESNFFVSEREEHAYARWTTTKTDHTMITKLSPLFKISRCSLLCETTTTESVQVREKEAIVQPSRAHDRESFEY